MNAKLSLWLDGERPANTCICLAFSGKVPMQLRSIPTPKIHLQVLKIAKFGEITLLF